MWIHVRALKYIYLSNFMNFSQPQYFTRRNVHANDIWPTNRVYARLRVCIVEIRWSGEYLLTRWRPKTILTHIEMLHHLWVVGHTKHAEEIQRERERKKNERYKYFCAYGKMHNRHKLNEIIWLTNRTATVTNTRCAIESARVWCEKRKWMVEGKGVWMHGEKVKKKKSQKRTRTRTKFNFGNRSMSESKRERERERPSGMKTRNGLARNLAMHSIKSRRVVKTRL